MFFKKLRFFFIDVIIVYFFLSIVFFLVQSTSIICFFLVCGYFFLSNLFDPGRGYCYWDSIKPCKSNEFIFVAYGSVTHG